MSRSTLRWWLWSCLTFVALGIAGLFGFYGALLRNDVTYLGFAVIALYGISTAWIGWKIRANDTNYNFPWFIAELMERAGLLGTFVGIAIAFQALTHMDAAGLWKQELMQGVGTKFFCSIAGLAGAMMLKVQVKILDSGHEG